MARADDLPQAAAGDGAPAAPTALSADQSAASLRSPGAGDQAGSGWGSGGGRDLQASCVACPVPEYPRQARRRGWHGVVDLRLRLDGAGRVTAVEIARESGFDILDAAAVAAARKSRFRVNGGRPGQADAALWGQMRYRFELGGG